MAMVRPAAKLSRQFSARSQLDNCCIGSILGSQEIGALVYPAYLCGEADLTVEEGRAATAEFQRFLDNRSMVINSPLGPLARLKLARLCYAT
jgi:hypothetical protein